MLRAQTNQDGRACVRQQNIRGYGLVGKDIISINASGKNGYYLATTLFQCPSLQTSFATGFKGDFFELCGGGRDKIITREESCPILGMYEFSSREEAFATFDNIQKIREDLIKEAEEKATLNEGKKAE